MKKLRQAAFVAFATLVSANYVTSVSIAEDSPEVLAEQQLNQDQSAAFLQAESDAQFSQVRSELRSQRDLAELRLNMLENKIDTSSLYVERLLFAFVVAGAIVTFVVLTTLNKQTGINNEKMRNLIRESERALGDLHRMLDRPEAEHFHVSRKLAGVMNKMRQNTQVHLTQKEIRDIYASADDPTLPVALHLQANALKQEQSGDFGGAIQLWNKLLAIDDSNAEVYLHIAQNFKQLAETNSDGKGNDYRKTSLDFFHQYAMRTNHHMQAEQEVRRHLQLAQDSRKKAPLDIRPSARVPSLVNQPTSDVASIVQPKLKDKKSAGSAFANRTPSVVQRSEQRKSEPVKSQFAERAPSMKRTQSKQADNGKAATVPTAQVSAGDHKSNGSGTEQKVVSDVGKAPVSSPTKPPLISGKIKRVTSATTSRKVAKPSKHKGAYIRKPALRNENAAKKSGKPLVNPKDAYKSRMTKADECFARYTEAKPKEQRAWLEAALSEFAIAEKYDQEEKLYRLWGIALLEMLKSEWGEKMNCSSRLPPSSARGWKSLMGDLTMNSHYAMRLVKMRRLAAKPWSVLINWTS